MDRTIDPSEQAAGRQDIVEVQQCPLFDLPRELRNKVYANLTQPIHDQPDRSSAMLWVRASSGCVPQLRLVNQQFKQEYEEEAFCTSEIRLMTELSAAPAQIARCRFLEAYQSQVRHVTLRMEVHPRRWTADHVLIAAPTAAQVIFTKALPVMPCLQTAKLEVLFKLKDWQLFDGQGVVGAQPFLNTAISATAEVPGHPQRYVPITRLLLLPHKL